MTFFITVIAYDNTNVQLCLLFFLLFQLFRLQSIYFNSQSIVFLRLLVSVVLTMSPSILFLLFASLVISFGHSKLSKAQLCFDLRLLDLLIPHISSLNEKFRFFGKLLIVTNLLIYFSKYEKRQKIGFSRNFNSHLHQIFPVM